MIKTQPYHFDVILQHGNAKTNQLPLTPRLTKRVSVMLANKRIYRFILFCNTNNDGIYYSNEIPISNNEFYL